MINRLTCEYNIGKCGLTASKKELNGHFSTHWHDFYEFEFVLDGNGTYIIDGMEYEIKKGMLFFMSPINFHEVQAKHAKIINVMFSDSVCSENALFTLTFENRGNAFFFDDRDFLFLCELFNELISAFEKNNRIYSKAIIDTLLLKISEQNKNTTDLTYVQSAMLYIRNNFRNKLTLPQTAAYIGLSPSYFSYLFPKESGVTFKEYLNSLRFEYAKKLVLFSAQNISEICFDCGFDDYANFLRGFKKRFGASPGQFRHSKQQ